MKKAQIGEDLKLALSLSSDGFIIIENYEIIWMNESAEEILGKPEKNHDDRTLDSIFSEENKRKILAQRETRGTNSIEISVSGKGVFEFRIDYLIGKGNQWIVNIKDLNKFKKLMRSTERAELGLKNLLDNLNEGVVLLHCGKIEFLNTQGADILRSKVDSCVGKQFIKFIHKADQQKISRRIANTERGVLTAYEEVRSISFDGDPDIGISMVLTVYDDKPMVQVTINDLRLRNILKREQGRVESLQLTNATLLDEIEEHKKTKEKLQRQQTETKEQKTRLQAVYDSSGDAMMCTIDNSGLVLVRNKTILNWSEKHLGDPLQPGDNLYKFLFEHRREEKYQHEINVLQENIESGINHNVELALRSTTGKDIWLEIHMAMMRPIGRRREASIMMFDHTEKHLTDKRIRDSLLEKEVLLKEIHHRVKNNMQLISSMLSLQSGYTNNVELSGILNQCQQRIQSMAYIHEMIYRNPNLHGIEAAEYIGLLSRQLIQGYDPATMKLTFSQEVEHIPLTLDEAIPIGLIINELLINSLKHAYVGREKGTLMVKLKESAGQLNLTVVDDGVGLKEEFGSIQTDSLGTQLVLALTQQLDGVLTSESSSGTTINIVFPKK